MAMSLHQALISDAAGNRSCLGQIRSTIAKAVEEAPEDLGLAYRYINHLAFSGAAQSDIDAAIDDAIHASSDDPQLTEELIVPAADILARIGEYSKAYQLLGLIPEAQYSDQAELLKQQLDKTFLVEENKDIVGWERLGTDWHLRPPQQLPDVYRGRRRDTNWIAGKVAAKVEDMVYLRVGAVTGTGEDVEAQTQSEIKYGGMDIEYQHWLEIGGIALPDFDELPTALLPSGTPLYWEIGSYARYTLAKAVPSQGFAFALPIPVPSPWRFPLS